MPRYFKLNECERLLPEIRAALQDAVRHKAGYDSAERELEQRIAHIRAAGGAVVNRSAYLEARARRDTSSAALKQSLQTIEKTGATVKDLEIGLIDFLSLYRGREVCLCWKLGEDRIAFWHGVEEGFRGRKPIDEDFLRAHGEESAGAPN